MCFTSGLCVTDKMSFYCLCGCIIIRKVINPKRPEFVLSVISADGRLLNNEESMMEHVSTSVITHQKLL
jgi:predicted phosphoribosyltransferase